ncbi:MAG: hypothetical protein U9N73_06395, partial [Candidatus Auribacterota bacterium]|nr:hypothetical protein [Candidatus Auribacterota bacterium]
KQEEDMQVAEEILHENCRLNHSYLIEMGGSRYQARFMGYPDRNQYNPRFEIVGPAGELKVLRELD